MSYSKKEAAEMLKQVKSRQEFMGKEIARLQSEKFHQKDHQTKQKIKNMEKETAAQIKSDVSELNHSVKGKLATKVEQVFKEKGEKITEI